MPVSRQQAMAVCKRKRKQSGDGLVNSVMNKLPVELHIPGYQYCGPGTKLAKRIARGDQGINPLDAACKEHDIAYSKNKENLPARHQADSVLAERAWSRVLAKDASFGEKAAAWGVANVMKAKKKLGMGVPRKKKTNTKRKKRSGRGHTLKTKTGRIHKKKVGKGCKKKRKKTLFRQIVNSSKESMQPGVNAVKTALKGAREAVKNAGGRKEIQPMTRILPIPEKTGGILPAFLIPLFAGLSATGALAGGAAGIAKAVNDAKAAKEVLEESKRHNRSMESIALGQGFYMKPYKHGMGLQLNSKNV